MLPEPVRHAPPEPAAVRVRRLREAASVYRRAGEPLAAARFAEAADAIERSARPDPAPDGGAPD